MKTPAEISYLKKTINSFDCQNKILKEQIENFAAEILKKNNLITDLRKENNSLKNRFVYAKS